MRHYWLRVGGLVLIDVFLQAGGDIGFLAFLQFLHHFIEGEVDHVVMVNLVRRHQIAEAQPETVHEAHFVGSEIRRVRAEQEKFALPSRRENFQIKLRARIGELLPGEADLPGLFGRVTPSPSGPGR